MPTEETTEETPLDPPVETLYKIGVNADCPVHQVCVGGQTFPRTSEKVSGYGASTKRSEIQGSIVLMQPGQIDKIKAELKYKVVRGTEGKKARMRLFDTRMRRYRPRPSDVPVAKFLYILPLTPADNPHSQGPAHPSLAEPKEPLPSVEEIKAAGYKHPEEMHERLKAEGHKPAPKAKPKGKSKKPLF